MMLLILNSIIFIVKAEPIIVKGDVYINNVITEPEEVHLTFPNQSRIATTDADGHYIIVFDGEEPGTVGNFYIIYSGETYAPAETVLLEAGVVLYNIDLYIETADYQDPDPSDPDPSDPNPVDTNDLPKADAGGPYYEIINNTVTFDASASTDPDGEITSYNWDLGDGTLKTGITVTHNYSAEGEYEIILTVTDNNDTTDEDITYATIRIDPDNPPSQPILYGNTTGSVNNPYSYTAYSTDSENNTVKYIFDWDDQTETISEPLPNGTNFSTNHQWNTPGIYTIKVYAEDNESAISKTTSLKVLIDTIYCQNYGYLIDYTEDGIYDVFHSNHTGMETFTKKTDNNYLINDDDDDKWDFEYNLVTDTVANFGDVEVKQQKNIMDNATLLFIVGIIVIIFFTIISLAMMSRNWRIIEKKEKRKNKGRPKPKKQKTKTVNEKKANIEDVENEVDEILKSKNNI